MSDFSQTVQSLPWSSLIPVGLLIVVGLLLWAAGRRVLRTGFIILGLGLGGVIGWFVGDSIKLGVQPWIATGIGAGVFAGIAALSYRFALVGALAMICGVLAPLAVLTLSSDRSASADPKPSLIAASGLMSGFKEIFAEQQKAQSQAAQTVSFWHATLKQHDRLSPNADLHIQQMQTLAQQALGAGAQLWNSTPQNLRPTLIISAVIGTIAGLLMGIVTPLLGASAVTALGGSMLWLSGGRVMAAGLGAPASWWPHTASGWFTLWLITAAAGLVIQWAFRRRLADKTG